MLAFGALYTCHTPIYSIGRLRFLLPILFYQISLLQDIEAEHLPNDFGLTQRRQTYTSTDGHASEDTSTLHKLLITSPSTAQKYYSANPPLSTRLSELADKSPIKDICWYLVDIQGCMAISCAFKRRENQLSFL